MSTTLDSTFQFYQNALSLRESRQRLLASNIANADTPHYKAVDIDFSAALRQAMGGSQEKIQMNRTASLHLSASNGGPMGAEILYRAAVQPSIDGNTVDMDTERAQFSDNAIHYEAGITFLNMQIRGLLSAIQG